MPPTPTLERNLVTDSKQNTLVIQMQFQSLINNPPFHQSTSISVKLYPLSPQIQSGKDTMAPHPSIPFTTKLPSILCKSDF